MVAVLIGPPGAGKSTLAPLLAAALGTTAHDLDAEIEAAAGRTIAELFAAEGEAAFRRRERDELTALLAGAALPSSGVIATGAGCVLDPANRAEMRGNARVVFLAAAPSTQLQRLSASAALAQRPLLAGSGDPLARLAALYAERLPLYRAAAHFELATDGRRPEALVAALAARLRPKPGR
jgi:shikimate kinase